VVLRLRTLVCCLWALSPLRGVLTSQQQPKCCGCGGNHTATYRGCAKWKEAKAVLAKRVLVDRNKGCGTPSPPAIQAKRAEPSAEQKLGPGWNHVRGGHVVKATKPPTPTPSPVTENPPRNEVTTTRK